MSYEGIPPDPYDQIGVPRDKNSKHANFGSHPQGQDPAEQRSLSSESKARIRAWSLWIVGAVIVIILLVVAIQLIPIA